MEGEWLPLQCVRYREFIFLWPSQERFIGVSQPIVRLLPKKTIPQQTVCSYWSESNAGGPIFRVHHLLIAFHFNNELLHPQKFVRRKMISKDVDLLCLYDVTDMGETALDKVIISTQNRDQLTG